MSLINQMLRDLQQQDKDGVTTKPDSKREGRLACLPLPLVLGGAVLLLLCLVWWSAGALSDKIFGSEPLVKTETLQKIVAVEQSPTTEIAVAVLAPDQLTMAEREAEPPDVPVVDTPPAAVNTQPEAMILADKVPDVQPIAVKPLPIVTKPSVSSTAATRKQVTEPAAVTKTSQTVQKSPAQIPTMAEATSAKRLHPDDLPGAVLSRRHRLVETSSPDRPSGTLAMTPYGLAEEAYADAKLAFAQERGSLAVRSLQQALLFYPGHLPAREMLVEIFAKEGKSGEAMSLLAEGLEIAPDYMVFKKKYARLLIDQGDYDEAAKVMLNVGLPTVEGDPEAHVLLASIYQRLGEPFLAAQTYRNLLIAWPQTGAFWVGLGSALEGQNLFQEAAVCYQRALDTKGLSQDLNDYAEKRLGLLN
ncbi:MAG: tetratricopeptide repeat protein [Desulfuromonadales bacterium]|nr:tetratricopeptide repeat protein [Desulfuromonadales bacterium]